MDGEVNSHLQQRLRGLQEILVAAYNGGLKFASASKGSEREAFVSLFLSNVLPPTFRFGSGEITDASHPSKRSGQLDVVVEMPFVPSFALPLVGSARLYPAEAVGAVIEVKSNIAKQFKEVKDTASALAPLRERLDGIAVTGGTLRLGGEEHLAIPLFAVGFTGWGTAAAISRNIVKAEVDGILVVDKMLYVEVDRAMQAYRRLTYLEQDTHLDAAVIAARRILELEEAGKDDASITAALNAEGLGCSVNHLNGQFMTKLIDPGDWTEAEVTRIRNAFHPTTTAYTGEEAILRFISRINQESSKRAAMSFDFAEYV